LNGLPKLNVSVQSKKYPKLEMNYAFLWRQFWKDFGGTKFKNCWKWHIHFLKAFCLTLIRRKHPLFWRFLPMSVGLRENEYVTFSNFWKLFCKFLQLKIKKNHKPWKMRFKWRLNF